MTWFWVVPEKVEVGLLPDGHEIELSDDKIVISLEFGIPRYFLFTGSNRLELIHEGDRVLSSGDGLIIRPEGTQNAKVSSELIRFRCILHGMLEEVRYAAYDRVEFMICGYLVRAWRTNTAIYLGYKNEWDKVFTPVSVDRFAEMLMQRLDSTPTDFPRSEKSSY